MSVPALNVDEIAALKGLAEFYKVSFTDIVRDTLRDRALRAEAERKKRAMIRQRLANLPKASPEESAEILALIDSMTEEDHEVVSESVIYV